MKFVLATANEHKASEIYSVFPEGELDPRPVDAPAVDESDVTLYGNALLKARAIAVYTGRPALADDTGLEIDARRELLGSRTARFAPDADDYAEKIDLVLAELHDVPAPKRTARFISIALAYFPDGTIAYAEGRLDGYIATVPSGDNGFGYDPIFVPQRHGHRTYAELTTSERLSISHRVMAFRALRQQLNS